MPLFRQWDAELEERNRQAGAEAEAKVHREQEAAAPAAKKHQEEEAAATHKREEGVGPKKKEEAPGRGSILLASTGVGVQSNGKALVKLDCLGIKSCHGKLTLTARGTGKAKGNKARRVLIGTVGFSIAGDETKTEKIKLNAAGRALLSADHGHLSARLAILELAPSPQNTQTKTVELVRQKALPAAPC
jgi:hypothetical protein